MEKDARYFMVGVFVSLGIAALVGFVIWLAGPHEKKDYVFYTVEFTNSIGGLEKGADVTYKGLKVGEVTNLRLVPECFNLVRVDVGVKRGTPVRAHTAVTVETQGFAGSPRLEMSTEDADTAPPERIAGEPFPLLEGSGSRLTKALADVSVITGQMRDITQKLDNTLDAPTLAAVQAAVVNVEHMTRDMNGLLSPANVSNASQMIGNLSEASARAPELMDSLQQASTQAKQAAGGLSGMLRRNRANVDRFVAEGLPNLTAATEEAKGAAASVRKLSDKLEENPSQILYQPTSHGVEIPK